MNIGDLVRHKRTQRIGIVVESPGRLERPPEQQTVLVFFFTSITEHERYRMGVFAKDKVYCYPRALELLTSS